ncbi:MAG: putative 2-aminoethylphosphonate ABC transporter substrate-binding protein [Pseudomonadales bacterium]|jgi:iron(III) transport system substrate-binding protein|nr:putative 2-aminoethylphosphonate ABC transporter substrate-binding protein [Acidiferrobacteraceae bacterium]MDP6030087.1 putative 2-aminoethylphosphonate ABC transporter substrate-binding protein [Arenicellales bacterium]MDP6264502.1 putative 2-aminoethylphosphonate ABC transporter substrate-binding protein [Pseudomonadales bacterium]MDP7517072.1 putative 2-aminoethylphosphonate ABC transporter substrate-binding protein [Arenicellales bacterium]|tara:strand:- start:3186 stop:4241 length:1056 start_codon:yes stop_codon:yes gene_type:complete
MKLQLLSRWGCRLLLGAMAALLAVLGVTSAAADTKLTVYTALEAEELEPLRKAFRAEHPDIDINWVRDSTGIITAKMLAEIDAGNPQADVFLGTSATSLLVVDAKGMLLPYAPKGLDKLDSKFRDARNPPHWVGVDAYAAVVCYNTIESGKSNLPKPSSWQDLLDPVYKGHLVMPNPNSSGTGFLTVSSWIQIMGEDAAWAFMDAIHENMARYTHSGSKPCRLAAAGEHAIGISFVFRGAKLIKKGAPLELVLPKEGIGWEVEASGILKTSKKIEAAKTLIDWHISPAAMKVFNDYLPIIAIPELATPVAHFPENTLEMMIDNDFGWAADNRKRILGEWQKRYDAKSEPKG